LKDGDLLLKTAAPEMYQWWSALESKIRSQPDYEVEHLGDKEAAEYASKAEYPRLITALSLFALAMQEVGKAALAIEQVKKREDLSYESDYREKFLNHRVKEKAAADLMKKLKVWPPPLEKRSKNLEVLRQAALYVDFDFNFGIWVDPSALGSPEESGSMYSGALFTGLVESLSGSGDDKDSEEMTALMLGTERFNTFSFAFLLKTSLASTVKVLEEYSEGLLKDAEVKREIGMSIRFAEYLTIPKGLSKEQEMEEMARRLDKITRLISPMIAGQVDSEVRDHFRLKRSE
jgi:AbiV family abortive infection protein